MRKDCVDLLFWFQPVRHCFQCAENADTKKYWMGICPFVLSELSSAEKSGLVNSNLVAFRPPLRFITPQHKDIDPVLLQLPEIHGVLSSSTSTTCSVLARKRRNGVTLEIFPRIVFWTRTRRAYAIIIAFNRLLVAPGRRQRSNSEARETAGGSLSLADELSLGE